MRKAHQSGFTLLEVLVALILFSSVLLAMLATGQLVLARLYEGDIRLRAALYSQSIADSLRGTACARLTSGTSTRPPLSAAWITTDTLDQVRAAIAVALPQRGSVSRVQRTTVLIACPEP